jgi:OFA family oxalate/formate antiporter-like MFS transporter
LAYGALIAVYPFAIAEYFGETLGPKVYGQVFTAWGFAGLAGPWLAGKLYDLTGAYQFALATAGGIAIISMVTFYGFLQYKAKYPLHLTRLAKV